MFQDFSANALSGQQSERRGISTVEQAAELIDRYPNISEVELARLINLYGQLSAVDVALMISDEKLGKKMDRFFKDHRAKVRTPFRQYAVLVAIAVVGIAVILWSMAIAS